MNKILEAAATKDPKEREKLEALAKSLEPKLSDLEVVHKALDMSSRVRYRCASLDFDGDSDWIVWTYSENAAHRVAEGSGINSLLAWAKQTVGVIDA